MSALLYRLAAQVWQGLGSDTRDRTLKLLKGTLPACFREGIKEAVRQSTLEAAIQRILASPPHRIPDDDTLQQLSTGWGNEGYSGDLRYLREVARQVLSVDSSVLECGSGVTTILMGLLGSRRGITIWTLEHDPYWQSRIEEVLQRYHIPGVELCAAPITDYGEFGWYAPPFQRLPKTFRLVICDGPPQKTTLGGRYGLLPVMKDRLGPGSVILLDNAIPEAPTIQRWREDFGVTVELGDVRTFAIIRPQ